MTKTKTMIRTMLAALAGAAFAVAQTGAVAQAQSAPRFHYDPAIRRRLLYVRNEADYGADIWQSMKDVGLIGANEASMLDAAQVAGNQAWALNQIAERLTNRIGSGAGRCKERCGSG